MSRFKFALLLLIILLLVSSVYVQPEENKILVLYKARDPYHDGIVSYLTGYLREAGFSWDTRDVESWFPSNPDMSSYKGIMTCYLSSQMVGADRYPRWLVKQMEEGRKILIVGSYGAYQNLIPKPGGKFIEYNESTRTINTFFWPFGLEFFFGFTNDVSKLHVTKSVKEFSQYESPLNLNDLKYYQLFRSTNPQNKVYLEVERADMLNAKSALVVHTPFGGMILEGYGYFWSDSEKKMVQRVNLAKFFKEALTGTVPPVPRYVLKTHTELKKGHPLPDIIPPKTDWPTIPGEGKRRILTLYKRAEAPSLEELPLNNRADIALSYLGLILDYRAVEDGLPSDKEMEKYRGIIIWDGTPYTPDADKYSEWLASQVKKGRRLVIMGEYGAMVDSRTKTFSKKYTEPFKALGMTYGPYDPPGIAYEPVLKYADPDMLGFERTVDPKQIHYSHQVVSKDSRNKVYLKMEDHAIGPVDLVVVGPGGGAAMEDCFFWFPKGDLARIKRVHRAIKGEEKPEIAEEKTLGAWVLNPYRFFTEALALEDLPAPDITTLNGSRIFYSHIDGDGIDSVSLIDRAHSAGEYIYEEIFKKYREIPFTVSVISGLVEKAGNEYYHPSVQLARDIYRLPNCEVATHTTNHPFDWIGGDPYVVNPESYPYQIAYNPHDYSYEIWTSKLFIENNLAPPDKKCNIVLWSGATNPDEKALAVTWRAGMHNLNGGDPRFDKTHPSVAGMCPYSIPYGPYRQYLTSGANDYIYMLFMTGDWAGQKDLIDHFNYTENPYRIVPMNLYWHFYSGIKKESLGALTFILDYIRSIDAACIYATEYCKIVEDFYNTRLWKNIEGDWICQNGGYLRTVRFRKIADVNMASSSGVLGYMHSNGHTYVHLDGSKLHRISFGRSELPFLKQSTFFVDSLKTSGNMVQLTARGMGKGLFVIGGLRPNASYNMHIKGEALDFSTTVETDEKGLLTYRRFYEPPVATYNINITRKGAL